MTTYNGYTKDLTNEQKLNNELETLAMIDPIFYAARIAQIKSELRQHAKPSCACFEYVGDNEACPEHGDMYDDYRERNDLRTMGMGG